MVTPLLLVQSIFLAKRKILGLLCRFKKGGLGLSSKGFLLYDSILSMLVFIIIMMLLPAFLMLGQMDKTSKEKLQTYRDLYMKSLYLSDEELASYSKEIFSHQSFTCDDRLGSLCP